MYNKTTKEIFFSNKQNMSARTVQWQYEQNVSKRSITPDVAENTLPEMDAS